MIEAKKRLYISLVLANHPSRGQCYRIKATLADSIEDAAEIAMAIALDDGLSFEEGWRNHRTRVFPLKEYVGKELIELISKGLFLTEEGDQEYYDFGPLDVKKRDTDDDVWPDDIS